MGICVCTGILPLHFFLFSLFAFSCIFLFCSFFLLLVLFLFFLYVCLLACLCPKERKKEGMELQGWGGRRELEGEKKRKTMIRYSVGKI